MPNDTVNEKILQEIGRAIRSLDFGTIQITVHNAKVVQIEKTERIRLISPHLSAGGLDQSAPTAGRSAEGQRVLGEEDVA